MKRSPFFPCAIFALATATCFADPASTAALAKMRAEYDQAISAATLPINRRYQAALEPMLHKAGTANDPDAPLIAAELEKARTASQTESALKAFFSGSHWLWFDTMTPPAKPIGQPASIDFFKDGTARTSWGSVVRYEVHPPAGLRITQAMPEQTWFFSVDLSTKEAVADKYSSPGRELRSLRFERKGPSVDPAAR